METGCGGKYRRNRASKGHFLEVTWYITSGQVQRVCGAGGLGKGVEARAIQWLGGWCQVRDQDKNIRN